MNKIIKKGISIFLWIFTGFVILFLALYLLLTFPSVQTWLVKRFTNHFSDVLHTRVEIKKVKISFPRSIVLEGFHVDDLHGNTLVNIPHINVTAGRLFFNQKNILLHDVTFNDAEFNLRVYRGEKENNMAFILHHFASNDTTPSSGSKVNVEKLVLSNCRFNFVNENIEPTDRKVNLGDLALTEIDGDFSHIIVNGDSVSADIKNFRTRDHSGFRINDMEALFRMNSKEIKLNDFTLKTPGSDIHSDALLEFASSDAFKDFASKVTMNATLGKSTIAFNDAAFFADGIKESEGKFTMQGQLKGTVSALKIKDLVLEYGKNTKLKGDVDIKGLPEFKNAYMDCKVEKFQSSSADAAALPLYDSTEKKLIVLPENVNKLGVFSFNGKFTGFYNDFVAFGNLNTALGFASTDINVKRSKDNKTSYSGRLALSNFDAGALAGSNDVGRVSLNVALQGSGFKLDEMKETANGTISRLEFKGYNYSNIVFNGSMEKSLFKGTMSVHETNADIDFDGTVDLRGKVPDYNFVATIGNLNLDNLKLVEEGKEQRMRTKLSINASGNSLQTLEGSVLIRDTYYNLEKTQYNVNNISVTTFGFGKGRTVYIRSDFFDGEISGLLDIKNFIPSVQTFLAQYAPKAYSNKTLSVYDQNASFHFRVKNAELLTRLFAPAINVDAGTELYGKLNTAENIFQFRIQAPSVKYNNITVTGLDFKINNDSARLASDVSAEKILIGQGAGIALFSFNAKAKDNKVLFALKVSDEDTFPNRLNITGISTVVSPWSNRIAINKSSVYLNNQEWEMSTENSIDIDSSKVKVNGLTLSRENQRFSLDGIVSKNSSDRLEFSFHNFNMQNINPLIAESRFNLGGVMNGSFSIAGLLSKLNVASSATIDNLAVNNDTVGNANIQSNWDDENQKLDANVKVVKGTVKIIDIEGKYLARAADNNFDFKVDLNNVYLHPFEKFVDDVFSDLYGTLSADLTLTGTPDDPELNGKVKITKGNFLLNFLNTRYSFTDEVSVAPDYFGFNNLVLNDANGRTAILNGRLMHHNFKDLTLNLQMQANSFQCLNTGYTGTEIYYGTAIATGNVTLSGPVKSLSIDLNLTSNKGTRIFFPLQSAAVISENNFITFINKNDSFAAEVRKPVNLPGVSLTSNLELTPDAEIQVIFDEKIGDVIKGNGNGNLKLTLTPAGEFYVNGNYIIQQGDYLFTAKNIINKKFLIERGSMITFTGDPYDADVNLNAVYKVSAHLSDLFPGDTLSGRTTVDCRLILTDKLFNPHVRFDVGLPNADATSQSLVKSLLNSEEEMSRQVISLLVLSRFAPLQSTGSTVGNYQGSAKATGSELLSNQVSNWLNQFNNKVNIGVNYHPKDAVSSDELAFALSTQQFNDQFTFGANVGYTGEKTSTQQNTQNGSTIIGDFNVEYKLPNGKVRLKAFNRTNNNALITNNSPYTQGVGVFYRVEFDKFRDIWKKMKPATSDQPSP